MRRLLAVCTLLFFSFLAFEVNAQLGSSTRTLKADVIDSNTASLIQFLKNIEISSTGYVLLPKGTTAQRPSTPTAGMFRYNTEENTFEGYTDEWGPIAGGGGLSQWSANTEFEANQVAFLEDDNIYKIYAAKALFTSGATFNKSNWDELSKSRADEKEPLLDGSFEYGVFEWSCTNATVTQAAGGVDGDFQAQIDFTADGGFCELVSPVNGDTANQEYLPRAYVKTSNANVKLEFMDGTRVVAEPEVLADGSYLSYAAQVIPSTSIITRVTGNNTDQAFVDAAGHTLGGFNRAPSKNCSSTLDCENTLTVNVENDGTTASAKAGQSAPDQWWDSITRTGQGEVTIDFTSLGLNSAPSVLEIAVTDTKVGTTRTTNVYALSNTSASFQFTSTDNTNFVDTDFSLVLLKNAPDYKTIEEKGVVTIPDNKDARLVVSNSSETTRTSIATTLTKIDLPDVDEVEGITWDSGTSTGTATQSGKYSMEIFAPFYNASSSGAHYVTLLIDSGSGFAEINQHPCVVYTNANKAVAAPSSCTFVAELSKGDQVQVAAISEKSGTEFLTDLGVNGKNVSPRLLVTPLGGRQNIGEFTGTAVYEGESGTLTAGYASFGGATDGSVCDTSTCTMYREVGGLLEGASVTRGAGSIYTVNLSGIKPGAAVDCDCEAEVSPTSLLECVMAPSDMIADASGNVSIRTEAKGSTGGANDGYVKVSCRGPRP